MIFGEWIKKDRSFGGYGVLLIVLPLVALCMEMFASFLLRVKTDENILCLSKPLHWYSKEKPEAVIKREALISPREIIKEKRGRKKSNYKTGVSRSRVMKKGIFSRMPSAGFLRSPIPAECLTDTKRMKQNIKWIFNLADTLDSAQ